MEFLAEHWKYFMLVFYMLEKVVKVTPWKWDDILFDIIFKTLKDQFLKANPKKLSVFIVFFTLLGMYCTPQVIIKEVPQEVIKETIYKTETVHDTITQECASENKITRTVYFKFDSYKLSDKAKAILANVDTSKPLEIKAHTCDIGTEMYNRSLRMQRGNEVYNYLFDNEKNNSFINYSEEKCNHGNRIFCRNVEVVSYE